MNEMAKTFKPGEARCPNAPTTQQIIHRDGRPVPAVLELESPRFLGDADIPFDRYTSPSFFQQEMEKLWPKIWQWACREEHIPEAGDYYVYEIGPYSILVVRNNEGAIKAYHNSCLHRGTKLRPSNDIGSATELRCPYHGWTWSLDGALVRTPCAWDLPHVKPEDYRLPEVQVALWGGFVFINMDPEAEPFERYAKTLIEHFKDWKLEDRYVELHIEKELYANWKASQEAFMENYHTHETHPQLMQGNGDENTQYDIFDDHVSRFYAANGVNSPHLKTPLSEQELVNTMLVGDRRVVNDDMILKPGETARVLMARMMRQVLGEKYKHDMSRYTDTEMLDVQEYALFPNMTLFPGLSLPMIYRFRPIGMNPNRSLFELIFLRPVPDDGTRPEPAQPVRLSEDESYTTVDGIDPGFGHVYDQDTGNLRCQQEGFMAAHKKGQTLTNYQESRIRHLHQTLDKYLSRD